RGRRRARRGGGAAGSARVRAAGPPPAGAGTQSTPTLTPGRLWNQSGRAGTWSPYLVTVRAVGRDTFTGTVALVPDNGFGKGLPIVFPPEYLAPVTVPGGGQRVVTIYAIEPAGGYRAELRDPGGRGVASASPTTAGGSGPAVAVVSDVPQAGQRVDALLRSQSGLDAAVSQLAGAAAFPPDVIRLSGLNAVVLD